MPSAILPQNMEDDDDDDVEIEVGNGNRRWHPIAYHPRVYGYQWYQWENYPTTQEHDTRLPVQCKYQTSCFHLLVPKCLSEPVILLKITSEVIINWMNI